MLIHRSAFMLAAASTLAIAPSAFAQVHAGDVLLLNQSGRLVTGIADEITGQPSYGQRVFVANLGAFDTINNPGFDSGPGALPPGSSIGFDILAALRRWQGGNFNTIPPQVVRMRLGPTAFSRYTPATDLVVPGFSFAIGADGIFHRHYNFTLYNSNPLTTTPTTPAQTGVYLLQLRLWSSLSSIQPTDPFWIVINQQSAPSEVTAAVNWVEANLIGAPAGCNPADICGVGATYSDGAVDIGPDNQLTIEDFITFLAAFSDAAGCPGTGPCNPADLCGVGATYANGSVDIGPDGDLTIEDFITFLAAFSDGAGCTP